MSIAIAIIGIDGIVLAVDDRVVTKTPGMFKYDSGAKKLWTLKNKYGLMAVNSYKGFSDYMIDEFKTLIENPEAHHFNISKTTDVREREQIEKQIQVIRGIDTYEEIVRQFSNSINKMCMEYIKDAITISKNQIFSLGFTLAGYNISGLPQIHYLYSGYLFTPDLHSDYYISGIPEIGDYYMRKFSPQLFDRQDDKITPKMSIQGLKQLSASIILETSKYTDYVSNNPQIYTITQNEGIQKIAKIEVAAIMKKVEKITNEVELMKMLRE